jgi:nucleotidyltransferase substrate binding protein (TIGR01987 family)
MMKLNLQPLEQAIEQLETSLQFANSEMALKDKKLFEQFRNSVIKCFEYTYEISWKMLKRQLEKDSPSPEVIDTLSFNDFIREGAEYGLIDEPDKWFEYRQFRNLTSHTYDKHKAQQVYLKSPSLLESAKNLLAHLKAKN